MYGWAWAWAPIDLGPILMGLIIDIARIICSYTSRLKGQNKSYRLMELR